MHATLSWRQRLATLYARMFAFVAAASCVLDLLTHVKLYAAGQGVFFALYGCTLVLKSHDPARVNRAVAIGLLGLSYLLWGIGSSLWLARVAAPGPIGWSFGLLCITGVVLVGAGSAITRSVRFAVAGTIGLVLGAAIGTAMRGTLGATPFAMLRLGLIFGLLAYNREHPEPGPRQCGACGYDCTGVTAGVCPECGESLTSAAAGSR